MFQKCKNGAKHDSLGIHREAGSFFIIVYAERRGRKEGRKEGAAGKGACLWLPPAAATRIVWLSLAFERESTPYDLATQWERARGRRREGRQGEQQSKARKQHNKAKKQQQQQRRKPPGKGGSATSKTTERGERQSKSKNEQFVKRWGLWFCLCWFSFSLIVHLHTHAPLASAHYVHPTPRPSNHLSIQKAVQHGVAAPD